MGHQYLAKIFHDSSKNPPTPFPIYLMHGSLQLNSCDSNSYNSKNNLNRRNCLVPSEFISTPLQESSYYLKSHNSKNHLNAGQFFLSCNSNFDLKNSFFLSRLR